MQIESQKIVDIILEDIYTNFKKQLLDKKLTQLIPAFSKDYVSQMLGSGIQTAYLKHPKIKSIYQSHEITEDIFPSNIPIDEFANFLVGVTEGKGHRESDVANGSKNTRRFRKTGSTFTNRKTFNSRKKKEEEQEDLSKYLVLPPNPYIKPQLLPFKQPSQEEIDLQYQLRAMQKKLYFTRQQRKKEQQEEQQRIKALRRRKCPELPESDFTYQTNGLFLPRKPFSSNQLLVDQMKHSQSQQHHQKPQKQLSQLVQETQNPRNKSQLSSRYQLTNMFNNSNTRQISHLPFIHMVQNANIREQDSRRSQGCKTDRMGLRDFVGLLEDRSFRHFSQIQKEKKEREHILKMQIKRASNLQQKIDKNPEDPDDTYNGVQRRQSYLMTKYLKKVREQREQPHRKSVNFSRVNFPRNTPIHRYYKHNFNQQRRYFESELIAKVLDNSHQ